MKNTVNIRNFLLLFFIALAALLYCLQHTESSVSKASYDLLLPSSAQTQSPKKPIDTALQKDSFNDWQLAMLQSIAIRLMKHSGFEGKFSMPELSIEAGMGTYYLPATGRQPARINVDPTTIRTAMEIGNNYQALLAFSIGHELAHHILQHNKISYFLKYYLNGNPVDGKEIKKSEEEEDLSDKLGSLMALLAGYTLQKYNAAKYIEQLYITYKLEEKQIGYPSLHIRKQANEKSVDWAIKAYHNITAANYALCFEEYALAAKLYEGVQEVYWGPEVLKNHSIALAKVALQVGTPYRFQPYVFAFEPEWGGRMIGLGRELGARNSLQQARQQQMQLVNRADKQIKYALRIDSSINMQLHQLMIQAILPDYQPEEIKTMQEKLQNILVKAHGKDRELARFIQGLYFALSKDTIQALEVWGNLHPMDQHLGAAIQFNLKVLNGGSLPTENQGQHPASIEAFTQVNLEYKESPGGHIRYTIRSSDTALWIMERKFLPENTPIPSGGKKLRTEDGTLQVFVRDRLIYKKNKYATIEKIYLQKL